MDKEEKVSYKIMQPLLLSACVAVGMMVGFKMNDKPENTLVSAVDFPLDSMHMTGRIEELIRFVESKYVEKIDSDVLIDEALTAVFQKLDPHSVYLTPIEVRDVNDQMDGAYNGIGVENFMIDDTVNVSGVLDNSPAQKSGLQPFDKIISIDGVSVAGQKLDYSQIRSMLRKEEGKEVDLEILRDSKKMTFNIRVAEVPVRTVTSYLLPDIKTAVVKIERFGSHTYKEFMEEVEKHFGSKSADNLILDLRDNPGGYLPEATNILCQIFEEKDRLLLYTEGRSSKRNDYKSNGKIFFQIGKVVVLIDENTASASEIIAGAIQDWDRGIIIGRRSYGKGLVQEQYNLNNGGAIRLTVARYYTPSGRSIQRDYSDRGTYEDDLNDRFNNGDLFHKDSTLVKNGGKYYTQLLKREVSGFGGISPDVFISMDDKYKDENSFVIRSYIPEFTYKYLSEHKNDILSKTFSNKGWDIPFDFMSLFKNYLDNQSDSFRTLNLEKLKIFEEECKSQITKLLLPKAQQSEIELGNDEFIKAAIGVIKDNKKPEDYRK